jgi:hypothetical protein
MEIARPDDDYHDEQYTDSDEAAEKRDESERLFLYSSNRVCQDCVHVLDEATREREIRESDSDAAGRSGGEDVQRE